MPPQILHLVGTDQPEGTAFVKIVHSLAVGVSPEKYGLYSPWSWGKVTIFRRIVEPYLFFRPREFTARTVEGIKVAGNNRDFIQSWIYFFGLTEPSLAHWLRFV